MASYDSSTGAVASLASAPPPTVEGRVHRNATIAAARIEYKVAHRRHNVLAGDATTLVAMRAHESLVADAQ
jgi:hypothetical protein